MNILALWGRESKGKTTTLYLLVSLLSNNFTHIESQKHYTSNNAKDCCYAVDYRGKKVGITTRGDTKEALEEDFKWMENCFNGTGCDLYICASRSKGATISFIETKAASDYIFWISKTTFSQENKNRYVISPLVENQRQEVNENQAEKLLKFIDEIIQNKII